MRTIPTTCAYLLVAAPLACSSHIVDLGGDAGSSLGASSASSSGSAPTPSATSCAFSGPFSDGSGFRSTFPPACSATDGPQHPLASVSDVRSTLVGAWHECVGLAGGLQFTSDGHFAAVNDSSGDFLPSMASNASGTFEVLDASSTLGVGTYEVRLSLADGGVLLDQVVFYDSPTKMRFFAQSSGSGSGSGVTDYVPALNWKFRAGVCGPPFGPYHTFSSVTDVGNRVAGRWIWCSGASTDLADPSVGFEITAAGVVTPLYDDGSGNVTTNSPSPNSGPYTYIFSLPGNGGPSWAALENFPPVPNVTVFPLMISVDECGRGLRSFGQVLPGSSPGATLDGGVSGGDRAQDYQRLP